jgi:hypothetical protein
MLKKASVSVLLKRRSEWTWNNAKAIVDQPMTNLGTIIALGRLVGTEKKNGKDCY